MSDIDLTSVCHTLNRSHQLLKSVWGVCSWCWQGSVSGGVLSASRGWLRRFLLLKLVLVLLLPHGAGIPLLVGCTLSLRALVLLRSPHISTKPSTVFLGQLALSDSLVLLQWALRLGETLSRWAEGVGREVEVGLVKNGELVWWRETVSVLCQQLLDAHHLVSLLLLGLLGLEATLVSRWPQQTRKVRTSQWAQFTCTLVWTLVLLELMLSLHFKILHKSRLQTFSSKLHNPQTSHGSLGPLPSLPTFSPCLRKILWLVNLWLQYAVLQYKAQKRKSCAD